MAVTDEFIEQVSEALDQLGYSVEQEEDVISDVSQINDDVTTARYVKGAYAKGDDLDYSTITPEEKQRLIDNIKADLIFASVETCEAIIDEI